MEDVLKQSDLFDGMPEEQFARLLSIARPQSVPEGEYLFMLGDNADRLFVVLEGKLETCFPVTLGGRLQDVAVGTKTTSEALGWSALVKPYRFTLSARAAEPTRVAAIPRQELLQVLDADPVAGRGFMRRLAEIIGRRLLTYQAMWAREFQRSLAHGLVSPGEPAVQASDEAAS